MIVNKSALSQEDAVFLTKCVINEAMKTPRKKISGAVLHKYGVPVVQMP